MMMVKAFNKWDTSEIKVVDIGLVNYIQLEPRLIPRTGAKYAGNRFHKSRTFIVERFMNKLMVPGHKSKKHFKSSGHNTGKGPSAYKQMTETLELIEKRTKTNPIKILVLAIENAAPREEIISIEYGGARYPKAVECAPQRRIDIAMRHMVQGSYQKCFGSKKKAVNALADEIIAASQMSPQSNAISRKLDTERQADSSR